MNQKEVSIYDFKKGDIITRIKPSKPIVESAEIGDLGEATRDRSHIGKPLSFIGIANGCIYAEKPPKSEDDDSPMDLFGLLFDKRGPLSFPIDLWEDGWSYYVDPYKIDDFIKVDEKSFNAAVNQYEKQTLKERLEAALENEDFEAAATIQKRLDSLK